MYTLSTLPWELTLRVFNCLDFGDKLHMSSTCKAYRACLVPELFASIRFTNDDAIAKSALAAVEAHGARTSRIEFVCRTKPKKEFKVPTLPPAAADILQGRHTPNLKSVRLHFDFDFEDRQDWGHCDTGSSIYVFEDTEDKDYARSQEEEWNWRALMNETWRALSTNAHVKALTIEKLVPKWVSAFDTEEFQSFLGRLESADFTIWGGENGAGWNSNTVDGYCGFLGDDLGAIFFRHMHNLKQLAIHAADEGPLGLEGYRHIPLPLEPDDMPTLQSIKLVNCFVCPELVRFIHSHAQVLLTLDLNECVSAGEESDMASNPISWAQFFDQVYECQPALTELLAGGRKGPLTQNETWGDEYYCGNDEDQSSEIQEIRLKLEAQPDLKLFAYNYMDDKYGIFFADEEGNVEHFTKGNDQRAYDRLMGLVKQNASALHVGQV